MKLKQTFLIALLCIFSVFTLSAQQQEPVKWNIVSKNLDKDHVEITITGQIEKNWHTYSQRETDAGPVPTSIKFRESKLYSLEGKAEEIGAHEEFVKAFDAKVYVFEEKAVFKQKIKRVDKKDFEVECELEYMSCNDMMCLPPKTILLKTKVLAVK